MWTCLRCDGDNAHICRIRLGRADYFCNACMNIVRDQRGGVEGADIWISVPAGLTSQQPE